MGVRILFDSDNNMACLYCSTSMWAFGPVMSDDEEAEAFLEYCGEDVRHFTDKELEAKYHEFSMEWDTKKD